MSVCAVPVVKQLTKSNWKDSENEKIQTQNVWLVRSLKLHPCHHQHTLMSVAYYLQMEPGTCPSTELLLMFQSHTTDRWHVKHWQLFSIEQLAGHDVFLQKISLRAEPQIVPGKKSTSTWEAAKVKCHVKWFNWKRTKQDIGHIKEDFFPKLSFVWFCILRRLTIHYFPLYVCSQASGEK